MYNITLYLKEIEKEFFREKRLLGIAAPTLADYQFCWTLNRYLGMSFKRTPLMDIQISRSAQDSKNTADLFSTIEAPVIPAYDYFSVYQHPIPGSEHFAYLYSNRSNGTTLIPKLKELDYFLLFPDSPIIVECRHLERCSKLKGVSWVREFDLLKFPGRQALIL